MEDKQAWVTCYLTDIFLSYIKENVKGKETLDYAGFFRGAEGFEMPSDPDSFLTDVNNWVPLTVLREVELQCEKISGRKDIAYHAARAYFAPGKKPLSSLFEIILQILNDVRSALIFANLWGAAQTNYLKLQSFEKPAESPDLYMLAQFDQYSRPSVSTINLIIGFCEGFPQLYPSIDEIQCVEEISQLRLQDVAHEFPDFSMASGKDRLAHHSTSREPIVEAIKVPLKLEGISLSREFLPGTPDAAVVPVRDGRIEVLTHELETGAPEKGEVQSAYRIVKAGVLTHGPLSYHFHEGRIYNAPYSRFRVRLREEPREHKEVAAETLRRDVSRLLFEHLKLVKQAQTRMLQFNIDKRRLTLENLQLRREMEREYSFAGMVGQSRQMRDLFRTVRSLAETDVTVLIQGETGTGKELIAKAIHYNSSRKAKRFVAINCGALSETLLESELFGHERGAFTGATNQRKGIFEMADGGTLFLDEIGEITPSTQVKLLRVLQEGEFQRVGGTAPIKVDVRIIAATNRDLEELVKRGPFRQDLYYRLNVFPITVPPLRERAEDVPPLVSHCIEKLQRSVSQKINGVSPQAMALLISYGWPGNVRELENVIQRMMVVAKGEILDVEALPIEIRGKVSEATPEPKDLKEIARESAEIIEKRAIVEALSKTGGNVTRAAKALGISRATLQNKMKAYGLRSPKE